MNKCILPGCCLTIFIILLAQSCTEHDLSEGATQIHTDEILFQEAGELDRYEYYRNGERLRPASESAHGAFRLRFNDIAWEALDDNGELPKGSTFPDGSVIVKEVYNGENLSIYAVMKKARSDIKSANGWLWAEYHVDGSAAFGIDRKGVGCTSCHGDGLHRDMVRTFDLH